MVQLMTRQVKWEKQSVQLTWNKIKIMKRYKLAFIPAHITDWEGV